MKKRKKLKKNFLISTLISLGIIFFFPFLIYASSLEINPIRLQLSAEQKITSFEIKNYSNEPVMIQLQGVKWTYNHGKDNYEPTKDILITPPIVKIAPHDTQLIRVGLLVSLDPEKGGTYRVFMKEIPLPSSAPLMGIKTLLEIRIPLLVDSLVFSKPQVVFSASCSEKQGIKVKLLNQGKSHLVLNKITLMKEGVASPLVEKTIFDYVIPNQKKEWFFEIPGSFMDSYIQILAGTDQGEVSSVIPLSAFETGESK